MDLAKRFGLTHVRTRLTLWYVLVLAAVLMISLGLTSALLFWQLRSQLDNYLVQDIETVEGLLYFDAAGRLRMNEDYHNHPESKQVLERLLEVRSPEGEILYRNERLGNRVLAGNPFPGEGEGGYSTRSARLADGTRVRMVSRRHTLDHRPLLLRLAYSEEPVWSDFEELAGASALALPVVLAIAGIAGYLLARRSLYPLEKMARRAEQITSERLHERLPVGEADDELAHLARVFNHLLARLEQSFEQLRRFTSDASHELRTPLASLRSIGEVGLQKDGTREDYRDFVGSMLEEVNRLTALVDSLLTIARADAGHLKFHETSFSAMDLARESAALFEVLTEEKSQHLELQGDESATVHGDRLFLRQALVNVIHNAVKFSPAGGTISVRVDRPNANTVRLQVADSGPGISPEHSAKIFDRFYRVEQSRSREAGGAGLGLSIAQWAVTHHGGSIRLAPGEGHAGSIFQIDLPAAAAALP